MTLLQALAKSEEYSCHIIHAEEGLKIKAGTREAADTTNLPKYGWAIEYGPEKVYFDTVYLGCGPVEGLAGEVTGYTFKGRCETLMPVGQKVKVILEPIL